MLADDRGHLVDADLAVLGTTGQRGLARLAEEAGAVLSDPLHEQAGRLVGDDELVGRRALLQPVLERAALAQRQRDDRRRRQGGQQPVLGTTLARDAQRLVGQQQQARRRIRIGGVGGQRVGAPGAEGVRASHHDQPSACHQRQRHRRTDDGLHRHLVAFQHLAPQSELGGVGEEAADHEPERIVQQLLVGPVQQRERRRLAAVGGLEEGGVLHGSARPPLRSG